MRLKSFAVVLAILSEVCSAPVPAPLHSRTDSSQQLPLSAQLGRRDATGLLAKGMQAAKLDNVDNSLDKAKLNNPFGLSEKDLQRDHDFNTIQLLLFPVPIVGAIWAATRKPPPGERDDTFKKIKPTSNNPGIGSPYPGAMTPASGFNVPQGGYGQARPAPRSGGFWSSACSFWHC